MDVILVNFKWKKYNVVFTKHALERMKSRGITFYDVKNSIENFDKHYKSYWKDVVEKEIDFNIIRTVFSINSDNIILITSMFLWK